MSSTKVLYLIGSLRNPRVPELAARLRKEYPDVEVFDDWFAAGAEADDEWKSYEQARSRSYEEALNGYAARHVFDFDRSHLDRATHVLLVLPAGKSGHMEVMYGEYGAKLKPRTAILLDPEDVRWDVMYQFIPTILSNDDAIGEWLNEEQPSGRGQPKGEIPNGGWPAGLFSQRTSRGISSFVFGEPEAQPRAADALGKGEIDRPQKQDIKAPCRCREERQPRR